MVQPAVAGWWIPVLGFSSHPQVSPTLPRFHLSSVGFAYLPQASPAAVGFTYPPQASPAAVGSPTFPRLHLGLFKV